MNIRQYFGISRLSKIMSNKLINLGESIDTFYKKEVDQISSDASRNTIFSFSGLVKEEMVYDVGVEIETYLKEIGAKKSTIRRVFFMFTESIQNIRKHALNNTDGSVSGAYIIENLGEGYLMSFFSAIPINLKAPFFDTIDFINSMDKDQLKAHYREMLNNGELSDKGGAGLGLISLGLKCTGPLSYTSEDFGSDVSVVKISFDLSKP